MIYDKGSLINPDTGQVEYKLRKTVYISGPMFSEGNLITNVSEAIELSYDVYALGWAAVVPHYDILFQLRTGIVDPQYYLDVDLSILAKCDAVLFTTDCWNIYRNQKTKELSGTETEYRVASALGIPVFYNIDVFMEFIKDGR